MVRTEDVLLQGLAAVQQRKRPHGFAVTAQDRPGVPQPSILTIQALRITVFISTVLSAVRRLLCLSLWGRGWSQRDDVQFLGHRLQRSKRLMHHERQVGQMQLSYHLLILFGKFGILSQVLLSHVLAPDLTRKSNVSVTTYLEFPLQLLLLSESGNLCVPSRCGIPRVSGGEVALVFRVGFEELRVRLAKHIIGI